MLKSRPLEITDKGHKLLLFLNTKAKRVIKALERGGIVLEKLEQDEEIQRAILNELFNSRELGIEPDFKGYLGDLQDREQFTLEEAKAKFNPILYGLISAGYIISPESMSEKVERGVIPTTELWRFTVEQLRAECRKRSLPWSGNKEDLVRRLKRG